MREKLDSGKVTLSMRLYFRVDYGVIILFLILLCLEDLYRFASIIAERVYIYSYGNDSTLRWDRVAQKIWKIAVIFITSQLCLIYPLIALSDRSVSQKQFWANIKGLRGNRLRAFVIIGLIQILYVAIAYITGGFFDWLDKHALYGKLNSKFIGDIEYMLKIAELFSGNTLMVIFSSKLFASLSSSEVHPKPLPNL